MRKKIFVLAEQSLQGRTKSLVSALRAQRTNQKKKEWPFSYVLGESPFTSAVSKCHPSLVSLVLVGKPPCPQAESQLLHGWPPRLQYKPPRLGKSLWPFAQGLVFMALWWASTYHDGLYGSGEASMAPWGDFIREGGESLLARASLCDPKT
jgi:hypothetical protein